jgi:hypothetical protein
VDSASELGRIGVELETQALRAAQRCYDELNATFFRQSLRRPRMQFLDGSSHLGRWLRQARVIELGRKLLVEYGWGVLVEVLKHEMAHQYVDEVLGRPDESTHGPIFRKVCEERGIDYRAAGVPQSSGVSDANTRMLERVAKLLALAESSNVHEAEAAMSAAQRLMLKYNIDAALQGSAQHYTFRHLGNPSGRVSAAEHVLAAILDEHFFVDAIWIPVWRPLQGKRGSVLEVCGTPENVEMAAYAHSFLLHTAGRLWKEHQRKLEISANAKRRSFVTGVMQGFREKLSKQKHANCEQGLVWAGDAALRSYFKQRHPYVRHSSYGGGRLGDAFAQGRRAGHQIVLHRGVSQGSSGERRLLPAGPSKSAR